MAIMKKIAVSFSVLPTQRLTCEIGPIFQNANDFDPKKAS